MSALDPRTASDPISLSAMLPLQFWLLGGCEIHLEGRPLPPPRYRKEWWLLALLVLKHDRELSRDTLAAAFWPESDPDRALLYLRRSLTNLRHALGVHAARLKSPTSRTLRFDVSGAFADVVAFDAALKKTPTRPPSEEALTQAVALYRGPLLPDCDEEWVLPERTEREQAYLAALEALAEKARERKDLTQAVHSLRRLLAADPYRESASAALMKTLAEGGDYAAVTQVYQDLRRRLHDDLNTAPSQETKALYRRLTEREARPAREPQTVEVQASLPSSSVLPSVSSLRHLPIPLSDLVGRRQEIEEVTGWLRRARLVTLLGVGGVGKTRLSIAAAAAVLPEFSSGVWFVDLAPVTDAARVAEAAAKAIGTGEEAGASPEERLTGVLSSSSLLLVLDNCEQVLDASAALSARLLAACPQLRILATSRQALGIPGEQVYLVPSLRLPPEEPLGPQADPAQAEKNVPALLEYDSVRLFVERARQANPAFRLIRRNAEAVAAICRHLDGIPLALELAAARVRSLTPQEIEIRLEDRFRLLATGNRSASPRHQTLRAAIDWSYELLSDAERRLLRQMSVFVGGWRLEAAEAICAGTACDEDALDLLGSLVDKSMAAAEPDDAGTRYGLLETVRQYARDRLRECGEEQDARRRHAFWALSLAEEAEPLLSGAEGTFWLDCLEAEQDNLHAALDWYAGQPDLGEEHLRLAGALTSFWAARGHYRAGRQLLQAALSHAEGSPPSSSGLPFRAKALRGAAILASSQGDYPMARAFFEDVLTLRREIGDKTGIAIAINNLGTVTWLQGDLPASQALYTESLGLYREQGYARGIAQALYNISLLAFDQAVVPDDFVTVQPLLEEVVARFSALEDMRGKSYALNALGNTLIEREDFKAAQEIHEQNLALARELNDPLLMADAQAMLGVAMGRQKDYSAASFLLKEALRGRLEMGDKRNAAIALTAVASIFAAQGRNLLAGRLWGALETLREKIGFPRPPRQHAAYDREVAQAREGSDKSSFADAWAAGQALTWEQAVEWTLSNLA